MSTFSDLICSCYLGGWILSERRASGGETAKAAGGVGSAGLL